MGATDDLRHLPKGWAWTKPAELVAAWLGDPFLANPDDSLLPPGCSDSTWILHNQYICPEGVEVPAYWNDEEDPGQGFGIGSHPPSGWQRLTWHELAAYKGVPLNGPSFHGHEVPPCFRWEASLGRVEVINGNRVAASAPTEGSLGKGDLENLIPVLAAHTSSTRAEGAFSECDLGARLRDGTQLAVTFDLTTMLPAMLGETETQFTPEYWWPEDRSWVVWTDWDLEGTKVFGSHDLVQSLRNHPNIETLNWSSPRS